MAHPERTESDAAAEAIVAQVMDSMPQMKGWREAEIGWRVWTVEAIRHALMIKEAT